MKKRSVKHIELLKKEIRAKQWDYLKAGEYIKLSNDLIKLLFFEETPGTRELNELMGIDLTNFS